jgi:hypothetical protein
MLVAIFKIRRYARMLVFSFLLVNIALGFIDYELTTEMMNGPAGDILEIDTSKLRPRLIGRTVGSTILILYFLISRRVRRTLR